MKRGRRTVAGILSVIVAALAVGAGASVAHAKFLPTRPIDLNTATLDQLEELPSVGPAMARSILRFRRLSGPFERVSDLRAIRGIGRRRYEKIRPYVFVGKKGKRSSSSPPPGNQRARRNASHK